MEDQSHSPAEELSPEVQAFAADVQSAVARQADPPDAFSTKPGAELEAILRDTSTLPLESLLNRGEVKIDFAQRRIFRDNFWKGSFAGDTLLGWEERLRTGVLGGSAERIGSLFAGGSFWKRFDRIEDGAARGHVVNYEIEWLPGDPEVREVLYPDDRRTYFRPGDKILLLRYRNHPYRIVYDTIKVIDQQNAIGVMHLGEFPKGIQFSAFVMARNNYPFEKMSSEDHDLLFAHEEVRLPVSEELAGTWAGTLVMQGRARLSLPAQATPPLFHVTFCDAPDGFEARYRIGAEAGGPESSRLIPAAGLERELRLAGGETLLGRWPVSKFAENLLSPFARYLDLPASRSCRFVLRRQAA